MAAKKGKKRERPTGSSQGLRKLAGFMDGKKCCYCSVPTLATIEHVDAFTDGGRTHIDNLKIACPYCNTRKGRKTLEQFQAEKGWLLEIPDNLPENTRDMICQEFGDIGNYPERIVQTGSRNSQLLLKDNQVWIRIRAGRKDKNWEVLLLGDENNPKVARASYDFLKRHYTTSKTVEEYIPLNSKPKFL